MNYKVYLTSSDKAKRLKKVSNPCILVIEPEDFTKNEVKALKEKGYTVGNVDVTMIAQKPKLRSYIPQMEENIARVLQVSADKINVKATTEEHLGFTGDGSGMSCHAVCILE